MHVIRILHLCHTHFIHMLYAYHTHIGSMFLAYDIHDVRMFYACYTFVCTFFVPIPVIFCTFWYLFWVWDMKSEACRFEKSFEHSLKALKQQFYIVSNEYVFVVRVKHPP